MVMVLKARRSAYAAVALVLAGVLVAGMATTSAGASLSSQVIGGTRPVSLDVSGTRVVWADRTEGSEVYDVFLYDGVSGLTTRLTDGARDDLQPAIDGDTVVWVSYSETGTGADILAYDIPTRSVRVVCANPGDQVAPAISGRWVVWEDRSTGYSPSVKAFDLVAGEQFTVAASRDNPKRRPSVGGDLVVYEDYPRGSALDADVVVYDLAARTQVRRIGGAGTGELRPSTDGRFVAWIQADGDERDVLGLDLIGGEEFVVAGGSGEQTLPTVAGGVAYWIENAPGKRVHVRTRELPSGTARALNTFGSGRGAMAALAADASSIVWIENAAEGRQIRVILGGPAVGVSALAQLLPMSPAWLPFRLAQVSTGGDIAAPGFASASVEPGETGVDADVVPAVSFSKPLDATTVDAESVSLVVAESGEEVEIAVRYSAMSRSVVVDPVEPLADGTYTLEVDDSVTDTAGNTLEQPVALTFSTTFEITDTTAPRVPGTGTARVAAESGVDAVEITWTTPWDDTGVTQYLVYAHTAPMTLTTINSLGLTPVETIAADPGDPFGSAQSAVVSVAGARDSKYTLYYALRARDTAGNTSGVSSNRVADPHGTFVFGANVSTCTMCHSIHGLPTGGTAGRLGARSAEACFTCHGNTAATTAYGHASSLNTQADFYSYAEELLPEEGSRHRNDFMVAGQQECDACHSPHRKPYDAVAANSFSKLLKRETGAGLAYNTDAAPFGNEFCFSCHGSTMTNIADIGGMDAYANTAGDHNSAAFDSDATVAHGSANVYPTRLPGVFGPQVSCTACHNEHASPVGRLIDYRGQSTASLDFGQAELCFACHSSASAETRSAGSAPYAWNARDVEAEFGRTSSHPTVAGSGTGASLTCYSCHNTHYVKTGTGVWDMSRASDPGNTLNPVTTSSTLFCLSCHGNNPPVAAVSANFLVPYTVAFRVMSGSTYPFFAGWNKHQPGLTFVASTHATTAGTRAICENCHDPHGSDFNSMLAWTRPAVFAAGIAGERANTTSGPLGTTNICYQCHGNGTIGRTASVGAGSTTRMNVATPANLAFGHPVSTSQTDVDANHSSLEGSADLGATNRHSECVDCHDPHVARKTPTRTDSLHVPGTSVAGGALYGAIGVKPTWTGAGLGASVSYEKITLAGASTDYEAYLCFKCHTGYTTLPTGNGSGGYPTKDRAYEFNPNNASGHNVLGKVWPKTSFVVGGTTYSFGFPANVFQTGWSSNSMMTCSDCHTYSAGQARGPHGSSVMMGIDSAYPFDWKQSMLIDGNAGMTRSATGGRAICEKCHTNLRTANNVHSQALNRHGSTRGVRCVHCHVKVPHGWNRPRLIGYISDPEPYRVVANGVTAMRLKNYTPTTWVSGDCQASCADAHLTAPSPVWP